MPRGRPKKNADKTAAKSAAPVATEKDELDEDGDGVDEPPTGALLIKTPRLSRRREPADSDDHDLPDRPPPGWPE